MSLILNLYVLKKWYVLFSSVYTRKYCSPMIFIDIKQAVCFSLQTKWPPDCLQLLKTEIVF